MLREQLSVNVLKIRWSLLQSFPQEKKNYGALSKIIIGK